MTETAWLPNETLQSRRQLQRVLLNRGKRPERFHFSEFLTSRQVLFFDEHKSKIEAVEALVETLMGKNSQAALEAIWARERQGPLRIGPNVSILRGRLEGAHHVRAALGVCAKTRIWVVLLGPVDQTHLHMNLLTSLSALFRRPGLTEKLLKSNSAEETLRLLQKAEDRSVEPNTVQRLLQNVRGFLDRRYGWGGDAG